MEERLANSGSPKSRLVRDAPLRPPSMLGDPSHYAAAGWAVVGQQEKPGAAVSRSSSARAQQSGLPPPHPGASAALPRLGSGGRRNDAPGAFESGPATSAPLPSAGGGRTHRASKDGAGAAAEQGQEEDDKDEVRLEYLAPPPRLSATHRTSHAGRISDAGHASPPLPPPIPRTSGIGRFSNAGSGSGSDDPFGSKDNFALLPMPRRHSSIGRQLDEYNKQANGAERGSGGHSSDHGKLTSSSDGRPSPPQSKQSPLARVQSIGAHQPAGSSRFAQQHSRESAGGFRATADGGRQSNEPLDDEPDMESCPLPDHRRTSRGSSREPPWK